MRFHIISAMDTNRGIGNQNNLPWNIKKEMSYFKKITGSVPEDEYFKYYNVVIMGRKTWDSIPIELKPLPNRINIILSSSKSHEENIKNITKGINLIFTSADWQDAFQLIAKIQDSGVIEGAETSKPININNIFVIGGQKIYASAINHPYCDKVYLTEIYKKYDCDTFFPELSDGRNKFELIDVSSYQNDIDLSSDEIVYYRYFVYQNNNYFMDEHAVNENVVNSLDVIEKYLCNSSKGNNLFRQLKLEFTVHNKYHNHEEEQYLNLLRDIRDNGIAKDDRTGVGTISVFGRTLRYDLRDTFPMITTKKMFARGIFEELMMYLRGQTDNKILQSKDVHIWDANTSRKFLDNIGLQHFEEGDMGATYGFNFRYYGAEYQGCKADYKNKGGFDQLAHAINLIKNSPASRRILINLWNPKTLSQVALPSCLCQYQFYVDTINKELSLQIYLRSSDVFLAHNWNTCTGAMLVHMICNLEGVDLKPAELSVVSGDTHLYQNHLDAVNINLERTPHPFSKLVVKSKKTNIEDFEWTDFDIIGYKSYPAIKADMAI
jgi:dihydrofolate reductase/thymidylate synthase